MQKVTNERYALSKNKDDVNYPTDKTVILFTPLIDKTS